jgi:hypothetical protein
MYRSLLCAWLGLGNVVFAQAQDFPPGGHCVAWRTTKTMFLVNKGTYVGLNCKVQTSLKDENGQKVLEDVIPIQGFDSKNSDRDADIFKRLKGPQQPDLLFRSQPLANESLANLAKAGGSVQGELSIGGKPYPVSFAIKTDAANDALAFYGTFQGTFSQFALEAPRVAAGLIAKVEDKLELLFQFQKSELKGWPL